MSWLEQRLVMKIKWKKIHISSMSPHLSGVPLTEKGTPRSRLNVPCGFYVYSLWMVRHMLDYFKINYRLTIIHYLLKINRGCYPKASRNKCNIPTGSIKSIWGSSNISYQWPKHACITIAVVSPRLSVMSGHVAHSHMWQIQLWLYSECVSRLWGFQMFLAADLKQLLSFSFT